MNYEIYLIVFMIRCFNVSGTMLCLENIYLLLKLKYIPSLVLINFVCRLSTLPCVIIVTWLASLAGAEKYTGKVCAVATTYLCSARSTPPQEHRINFSNFCGARGTAVIDVKDFETASLHQPYSTGSCAGGVCCRLLFHIAVCRWARATFS